MNVALATSSALPSLTEDDQLLIPALRAFGIDAHPVIWNDRSIAWGDFDMCVIRSTWDYTAQLNEFLKWTRHVSSRTLLHNSCEIVSWNTDKHYLIDLERIGISIVPTQWVEVDDAIHLETLFSIFECEKLVVKPVVGAGGEGVSKIGRADIGNLPPSLRAHMQSRGLMAQPYFKSVETAGEFSFLFFNGEFSHAIEKTPAPGEYRVNPAWGGIYRAFTPSREQISCAQDVIETLALQTLYSRVDFLLDDAGCMRLSELELTEPCMFLSHDPSSARRFAGAIASRLEEHLNKSLRCRDASLAA